MHFDGMSCINGRQIQGRRTVLKGGGQFRERSEWNNFLDPHPKPTWGDRKMNTMVTEKLLVFHCIFNT